MEIYQAISGPVESFSIVRNSSPESSRLRVVEVREWTKKFTTRRKKMKERTLNQTWILSLRMWRSIAAIKAKGSRKQVFTLKRQWLRKNGIIVKGDHDCFFCEYNNREDVCENCPGKLVDYDFSCQREKYQHTRKPAAFYKELLRLNRIRKA